MMATDPNHVSTGFHEPWHPELQEAQGRGGLSYLEYIHDPNRPEFEQRADESISFTNLNLLMYNFTIN